MFGSGLVVFMLREPMGWSKTLWGLAGAYVVFRIVRSLADRAGCAAVNRMVQGTEGRVLLGVTGGLFVALVVSLAFLLPR